jgi:hypothetical protein
MPRGDHRQPRQRAIGHRDVDELALAAALTLTQGGEDPEGGHERAAAEVGDLAGGRHRGATGLAGEAEQAGEAQVVHVVARTIAPRPGLPVARDRAVHDLRVRRAHRVVADAEPVEHARAEGLQHDVVLAHEAEQHVASLRLLEIEPDRALVAVQREKERGLRALVGALVKGWRPPDVVAAAGVLDLEHVGAVVGEQQRAEAPGQQAAEIENADAVERSCHGHAP